MPGPTPSPSFDLSYVPTSIAGQALPIVVALYTPGAENPYTILPNVRCLRIDYREGAEPPLARFQYLMGNLLQAALDWPAQFEQLWPIDAKGDYIVLVDDRLVVLTSDPEGNPIVLFDGFAQVPQVDVSAAAQGVNFVAVGVAARLWDTPITGRVQRDADNPTQTDGSSDITIDGPCRFNPADTSVGDEGGYQGNAVANPNYTVADVGTYPVFIDPLLQERDVFLTSRWFVSDALSYLIATRPSPKDAGENPYVIYPTIASLQALLACEAPPSDELLNPSDAQQTDIEIRDYDATNKAVPDVFAELLRYCGFILVFATTTADDGTPQTTLNLYRRDALATTAPKPIFLAADGATTLDLAENNAAALHLARDTNDVVNEWAVETSYKQYEITVSLAPLFTPASGDGNASNVKKWYTTNLTNATDAARRKYRWYGADECGDGHWNAESTTFVTGTPLDLSPVFPDNEETGDPTYVRRYRPGSRTIIAKDVDGHPLKAILQLSIDNTGVDPELRPPDADTTGWTTVTKGWKLLDDRLGIEVTIENPEEWHTGANAKTGGAATVPVIRGVSWQSDPGASGNHPFVLQLTTVIESDQQLNATADKRIASPTKFARRRICDGKDHFQYCAIDPSSVYYVAQGGNNTDPLVIRDDTDAAKTHAEQKRSATEFPTLAGSVTIPFITDYYQIGDRVKIVQGRDASLQTNVGADQGETPTYPWVTAFSWVLEHDRQQTTLQLSDRRGEPQGV
jgi:hypothetical protein